MVFSLCRYDVNDIYLCQVYLPYKLEVLPIIKYQDMFIVYLYCPLVQQIGP